MYQIENNQSTPFIKRTELISNYFFCNENHWICVYNSFQWNNSEWYRVVLQKWWGTMALMFTKTIDFNNKVKPNPISFQLNQLLARMRQFNIFKNLWVWSLCFCWLKSLETVIHFWFHGETLINFIEKRSDLGLQIINWFHRSSGNNNN